MTNLRIFRYTQKTNNWQGNYWKSKDRKVNRKMTTNNPILDHAHPHFFKMAGVLLHEYWLSLQNATQKLASSIMLCPPENTRLLGETGDPRATIVSAFSDYHYADGQGPTESTKYHGVIGGGQALLDNACHLNATKDQMIAVLDAFRSWVKSGDNQAQRQTEYDNLLKHNHLSRAHYRQIQRHIHIIDASPPPRLISFVRVHTRNIETIDKHEAIKRLQRLGDDFSIARQLTELEKLPESELLAVVQHINPQVRINLSYGEWGATRREHIKTNLPLVVRLTDRNCLPTVRIQLRAKQERKERCDKRVSDIEFLPAIHAHRYEIQPLPRNQKNGEKHERHQKREQLG